MGAEGLEKGWEGEERGERGLPDSGAVGAGDEHDCAGEDQTFCVNCQCALFILWEGSGCTGRTVEVAEIEGMGMVCLPRGEEHGQARDHCGEGACFCRSETHGGCLEQAGKCAVQGVYAVAELRLSALERSEGVGSTDSNNSPSPLDVPVRLACFPSTLSIVEYLISVTSWNLLSAGRRVASHIQSPMAKL